MKEIERISLLKILRNQREEADKLIDSFGEDTKSYFINISKLTDNPKDKVGILDTIINEKYNCNHEYGLYNPNDSFMGKECSCLDCGEYFNSNEIKLIFDTKYNMSKIRKEYLELIQQMSVCDSFSTLVKRYNLIKHF